MENVLPESSACPIESTSAVGQEQPLVGGLQAYDGWVPFLDEVTQ